MSFLYKLFKNILLFIMLVTSAYWLTVCIFNFNGITYSICFALALLLLLIIKYFNKFASLMNFLAQHKIVVAILLMCFQIILILSTKIMIRSDAAVIFNSAIGVKNKVEASEYLSRNENNLFLFFYERFFYNIFGNNCVWILQFLNIVYMDTFIFLSYKIIKDYLGKDVGNTFFFINMFILGFTPQFIATYTDIMILPFIAFQLFITLNLLNKNKYDRNSFLQLLLLGIITGIGLLIRPTSIILDIAFFIICLITKRYKLFLSFIPCLIISLSIFSIIHNSEKKSDTLDFVENVSRNYLTFIDLGLTESGMDQIDFQNGLTMFFDPTSGLENHGYDNRFSKEVVLKDINRRLENYTPRTFIRHLLIKSAFTFRDGTLGWVYSDSESDYFINPLYDILKDNTFFNFFRTTFIYRNNKTYTIYAIFLQIVMCIMVLGLVISLYIELTEKNCNDSFYFVLLSVFGGFLFLMIFEAGKSRYLIQFLPQISLISSIGISKLKKKWTQNKNEGK